MTSEQFTYWLQGFFELGESKTLSETQVQIIKDHLDLVFNKVTPNRNLKVDEFLKEIKLSPSTSTCTHCGKSLGEGYICACVFKKQIEPYNPIKCIFCNGVHTPSVCPKLTVKC